MSAPARRTRGKMERGCGLSRLTRRETLIETRTGGWKVLVHEGRVRDDSARDPLEKAVGGGPYEWSLRELRLDTPCMDMLGSGRRLVVDFAEWINKMSGRGTVS